MTDEEEFWWTRSFEQELAKQLEDCEGLPDLMEKWDTYAELRGARHE